MPYVCLQLVFSLVTIFVVGALQKPLAFAEPRSSQAAPKPSLARIKPAPELKLRWPERAPKVTPIEYGVTGVAVAAAVTLTLSGQSLDGARWGGAIPGFDEAARSLLRARSPERRARVDDASDILQISTFAYVLLIDSFFVAGAIHNEPDVAWQLFVISSEAFALTALTTSVVKLITARERPFVQECDSENPDPLCEGADRFLSFPSGHASSAFTSAGLSCVYHQHLPLYGRASSSYIPCLTALALATTTAALRIGADRHHLSDVLAGAGVGLLFGYGLPYWLHFSPRARARYEKRMTRQREWNLILPGTPGTPLGLSFLRVF